MTKQLTRDQARFQTSNTSSILQLHLLQYYPCLRQDKRELYHHIQLGTLLQFNNSRHHSNSMEIEITQLLLLTVMAMRILHINSNNSPLVYLPCLNHSCNAVLHCLSNHNRNKNHQYHLHKLHRCITQALNSRIITCSKALS